MRIVTLSLTLLLSIASFAQNFFNADVETTDASRGVGPTVRSLSGSSPQWVAWTIPVRAKALRCGDAPGNCGACALDGEHSFSIEDATGTTEAVLALRVENDIVRRVRFFDASCPIDGSGASIHVIRNVSAEQSIAFLVAELERSDERSLLTALAMHDHPSVTPKLIELARNDDREDVRRHAIFWLGQKAGVKAAGELRRAVDEDPSEEVKKHAVFAISQLPKERSVPMLIDLVQTHASPGVRRRAMFWLAQSNDPRAIDLMEKILTR